MDSVNPDIDQPRRRLLSSVFRRPRCIKRLAAPITFDEVTGSSVESTEAAHWGEVRLLEDITLILHADGTVTDSRHEVTVLAGHENLAAWDESTLVYDRRWRRPNIREARAHLPDGQVIHAAQRVQRLRRSEPDEPTHVLTISFPYLRPGTILEWDYQDDYFKPNEVGPGVWGAYFLQTGFPCRRRRITVAVAQPFTASIQAHNGAGSPNETNVGQYRVFRWELKDVPAFDGDAWTPPPRDVAPWVDVSTYRSWRPIADHLRQELDPGDDVPAEVKRLAHELTQGAITPEERLFRIHRFLSRDVRYGRHPQEIDMSTTREMGSMLLDLRGDCKDKCAMMVSMLRELSIPAQVAVVLTGDNGLRPFLPSVRFNHAIVVTKVDGREMWLDPAAGPYTFGDTPFPDQGVRALVLEKSTARVVDVPSAQPDEHSVDRASRGELSVDGSYYYETLVTARGDRAAAIRDALMHRAEEHRRNLMAQSVASDHPGAKVEDVIIEHVDDVGHPPRYRYKVTLPAWARRIDELMVLRIPWLEPFDWSGVFTPAERSVPLVTPHVGSVSEFHTIQMPNGFSGYGLPLEHTQRCPWATYRCHVEMDGDRLLCARHVQFLGGIVSPEEYRGFQRFWEACVRCDREDIVLMTSQSLAAMSTVDRNGEPIAK